VQIVIIDIKVMLTELYLTNSTTTETDAKILDLNSLPLREVEGTTRMPS